MADIPVYKKDEDYGNLAVKKKDENYGELGVFKKIPPPYGQFVLLSFPEPKESITFNSEWTPQNWAGCEWSIDGENFQPATQRTITFDPSVSFFMRGDWRDSYGTIRSMFKNVLNSDFAGTRIYGGLKFIMNNMGTSAVAPVQNMFNQTFYQCNGLVGSIPEGFMGKITGTPYATSYLFNQTFYGCSGLNLEENPFSEVTLNAYNLIANPNSQCFYLPENSPSRTGQSPELANGLKFYNLDSYASSTSSQIFKNNFGLSDYGEIPNNRK
jgi:hypothetical protein